MSRAKKGAASGASSNNLEETSNVPATEQADISLNSEKFAIESPSEPHDAQKSVETLETLQNQGIPEVESDSQYQVEIPDYMIAELNADEQPEPIKTGAGNADLPATVTEHSVTAVPVSNRLEVAVDGEKYLVEGGRLYKQAVFGEKTVQLYVSSLIVVVANARDAGSSSWGKVVRFEDGDGNLKQLYIRNQDIMTSGNTVIRELVDEGLVVSTQRGMIDSLIHYLNLAPPMEPTKAICTDKIGWHDKVYLFPDNSVIGASDTRVVYTGAPISSNHTVKGTWQEWKENVASLCRGNSLLILAVCVSFATVLLRLLKTESGGYHLYGESSSGKSTSLYVAASVHGEPEQLMGSWRATANGVEGRAKKCNDSLMILDELHQSSPKEAGDAAYMIMNGKGKQRANIFGDARNVTEWRVNCLSSGEISCESFIQNPRVGQGLRMVDISADMGAGMGAFENIHSAKDANAFAVQLKKASFKYYGAPIREFIEQLTTRFDRMEENFELIKERFFEDFVPEGSGSQVTRVADKMAVVATAGELATYLGLTGWEENEAYYSIGGTFTRWLDSWGTTGQQEAEKAVEQVRNFLLRHGMSRFKPLRTFGGSYKDDNPERQHSNMAGYRLTNEQGAYEFIVFTEPYTGEMCQGLNSKYVTKTLVKRGFLMTETDGKPQVRRRLPGMDQARVYHFTSTILSDTDEFEPAEVETALDPAMDLEAHY